MCRHQCAGTLMCWHMPARVGTFLGVGKIRYVIRRPAHPSIQVFMWLISQVSPISRVGIRPKGVGTCRHLDVSARVSTFIRCRHLRGADTCQHIPDFQITFICLCTCATRVCTSKCLHRCRHLSTCWHVPAHRCRHPDCDIHSRMEKIH